MSATAPLNTPYLMTNAQQVRSHLLPKASTVLWSGGFMAMDPSGTVIPAASNRAGLGFLRPGQDRPSQNPVPLTDTVDIDFNMSVLLYIPDATAASVGTAKCYATADDTFTVSSNTCVVGPIIDVWDAANKIFVVYVTCA